MLPKWLNCILSHFLKTYKLKTFIMLSNSFSTVTRTWLLYFRSSITGLVLTEKID